jgi:hypothetical protein
MIKSRKMTRAERVTDMERRGMHVTFWWESPKKKIPMLVAG